MRLVVIPVFLFCVAFFSPRASASVASFGLTNQSITFTGLGGNALGEGQSRVTWGSCVYEGTNTTCTVSAAFTGVGSGGAGGTSPPAAPANVSAKSRSSGWTRASPASSIRR